MTKPRNLTLALVVIAFAQLMVVLDTTIVNVALPSIQRALAFSPTNRGGLINLAALAMDAGRFEDARRWIDRALAAYPGDPVALDYAARIERAQGP